MSAPAYLVIVADDGGVDAARDRGIVAAAAHGAVRAVSVLANGAHTAAFARTWHDWPGPGPRPDVGLHLNLTEGRPSSSEDLGRLVRDGRFVGAKRDVLRTALERPFDAGRVAVEARAQIERLLDLGLPISFANGHQHAHLFPGVAEGLAAALDAHPGVRFVRCATRAIRGDVPGPSSAWPDVGPASLDAEQQRRHEAGWCAETTFTSLSRACDVLVAGDRRGCDAFVGLDLIGRLDRATLLDRLGRARADVAAGACVEVMTHPGEADAASVPFSSSRARETERDALCDPDLPGVLHDLGYRLARFTDVAAVTA